MRKFHCLPVSIQLLIGRVTCARIKRSKGHPFLPVILLNSSTTDCRINLIHPLAEVRRMLCVHPATGNVPVKMNLAALRFYRSVR